MRQLYAAILDRIAPPTGATLLDAGCGAGLFCRLAAARGATVFGIDAAPALLDIARERVPLGTFDLGDVGNLPYADATFDVVTGINSFQYVSSPLAALREVKRVAKPDAQIVIAALGSVDECESAAYLYAIASMLPLTPSTPGPFALSQPGVLESAGDTGGAHAGRGRRRRRRVVLRRSRRRARRAAVIRARGTRDPDRRGASCPQRGDRFDQAIRNGARRVSAREHVPVSVGTEVRSTQ